MVKVFRKIGGMFVTYPTPKKFLGIQYSKGDAHIAITAKLLDVCTLDRDDIICTDARIFTSGGNYVIGALDKNGRYDYLIYVPDKPYSECAAACEFRVWTPDEIKEREWNDPKSIK